MNPNPASMASRKQAATTFSALLAGDQVVRLGRQFPLSAAALPRPPA